MDLSKETMDKRPIDVVDSPAEQCTKKPKVEIVDTEVDSVAEDAACSSADGIKTGICRENSLREEDVGITEFVNRSYCVKGVIKQRYSDFHVNEIDTSGRRVCLTTQVPPVEKVQVLDLETVLGPEFFDQIENLMEDENGEAVTIPADSLTKDSRRQIHEVIRKHYHPSLQSSTDEKEGKKIITIFRVCYVLRGRSVPTWPSHRKNYTQFVMYKENTDTMEAVKSIARCLRYKLKLLTYAGVKDKRAKTSQLVTGYRIEPEKLASLNSKLRNVKLGNFTYVEDALKLGDLGGNRFRVAIRKVTASVEDIKRCVTSLSEDGFINYFGMQRFGTTEVPTHHIGRALLLGQWQKAIELILKPRERDEPNLAECRKEWWLTRDAKKVYGMLTRKNSIEGHLLAGLSAHNRNDFVNALNNIPRNMRLMYVHSYQSYVWNRLVSRRIQKFGISVMNGDMYLPSDCSDLDNVVKSKTKVLVYKADESLEPPEMERVVMTLPGYDVKYPENEIADWYREILSEDGLDIDNMKNSVKSYSLSGSYRRVLVKPADVSWSVVQYADATIPIIQSDWEALTKTGEPDSKSSEEDGPFTAVRLEFSLPPAAYATMALREITKDDTSAAFQSTLN